MHCGHVDGGFGMLNVFRPPQRSDRFNLGKELDSTFAVKVQVALNRSSRAGKREHW